MEKRIMPTIAETWEARAELKRARQILQRQLNQRFGTLNATTIQQIEAADVDTLDTYLDRVLIANSLDEVFQRY